MNNLPQIATQGNLIIADTTIRMMNGLYSLNDLYKVSGGEAKHKPANFMRNAQTQALIIEIEQGSNLSLDEKSIAYTTIHGGNNNGTYVCKELVYAYAMWISAKFHLMVIRAFDKFTQGQFIPVVAERLTSDQTLPLRNAVNMATTVLKLDYSTIYSMIHQRFDVEHIKDLSLEQIQQAIEYIHGLMSRVHVSDNQYHAFQDYNVQFLMYYLPELYDIIKRDIYPALRLMQSPLAGRLMGLVTETACHVNILNRLALKHGMTNLEHVANRPVKSFR